MKLVCYLLAIGLVALPAFAQTVSLRGQVTDDSGAVIPGAKVALTDPAGLSKATVTAIDGSYSFTALPSGSYKVQASAPGFALRQPAQHSLSAGSQTLNLLLAVVAEKQVVTVEESGAPARTTEASAHPRASVPRG